MNGFHFFTTRRTLSNYLPERELGVGFLPPLDLDDVELEVGHATAHETVENAESAPPTESKETRARKVKADAASTQDAGTGTVSLATLERRCRILVRRVYKTFFQCTEHKAYGLVVELRRIAEHIDAACKGQSIALDTRDTLDKRVLAGGEQPGSSAGGAGNSSGGAGSSAGVAGSSAGGATGDGAWEAQLEEALQEFARLMRGERSISVYELQSSGIIRSLLRCLTDADTGDALAARAQLVISTLSAETECFFDEALNASTSATFNASCASAGSTLSPAVLLTRKLIHVLENSEKLPLFLYDNMPPNQIGFQLLVKRFKVRVEPLEQPPICTSLQSTKQTNEWHGKLLKIEPLATVGQLRKFLTKKVFFVHLLIKKDSSKM